MLRVLMLFLLLFSNATYAIAAVYDDMSNKEKIECGNSNRAAVVLALGQSNAANSGEGLYKVKNKVFNIFQGYCYIADDPLLGATGSGGSVWGRVADKLINEKLYNKVFIKSIAVGGSPMVSWTQHGHGRVHGNYFKKIVNAIRELHSLGFKITHILWHQGEQDMSFGTTTENYKTMFLDMLSGIRHEGVSAPIYVARASLCQGRFSSKVIKAQNELIAENNNIRMGPDTDLIKSPNQRIDQGCHFSESGLNEHAEQWLQLISL